MFFVFRLSLLLPIFLLAVFCLSNTYAGNEHIILSEILINGEDGSEFIELYNPTSATIDLSNYYLAYYSKTRNWDSPYRNKRLDNTICNNLQIKPAGFFLILLNKTGLNNIEFDCEAYTSSQLSNTDGSVAIFPDNIFHQDTAIDAVSWGNVANVGKGEELNFNSYENSYKSFERKLSSPKEWHLSCAKNGTPGQENSKEEDCKSNDNDNSSENNATDDPPKKSDYVGQVTINEIYPAPITAAGEKEFVEIKNTSGIDLDFSKWCLKDKTENDKGESGNCKKIDDLKKTSDFSVFYGTFSLNNDSKGDTVFLYDSNANLVDTRSYASPKSGYSYAFDESAWRWTSHITPGTENVFDKKLSGKILRDDHVYKNIYANFEVETDRDSQKFTWDFGDGHKSYLAKTKHKYLKTGTFPVSLKISGNGEDALYEFDVEVEKYAAPKIRIVNMSPNPKGSDTDNEWIEIKNSSKKKINLKGWSVATGWENLYNHPIREDFTIKTGKTKKLGRDICAFTLANTKTKIELRDPSGKAVQKIEYDSGKKSIQEDALYQKESGSEWKWSEPAATVGADLVSAQNAESVQDTQNKAPAIPAPAPTIPTDDLGKYSPSPTWQKKQNYQIELANFNSKLKIPGATSSNQPQVLGAHALPYDGTYYIFTQTIPQKHWLLKFYGNIWLKINLKLNLILNQI